MKHEINLGPFPMPEAAERRAQAALKMAITVHNRAIEEAALVLANRRLGWMARVTDGNYDSRMARTMQHELEGLIAQIRKLKRAP